MNILSEKKISSERIFAGRLLKVRRDKVRLPTGAVASREIVEHPGAVAIVAITQDNKLVLIRQFRQAAGKVLLEVPAGVAQKKEKWSAAAQRELQEETGYHAKKIRKVWAGYVSPGYSTEVIHFFLARELTLRQQKTEADENIEVKLVDLAKCFSFVKSGKIKDNKTIIAVMIANAWRRGEI